MKSRSREWVFTLLLGWALRGGALCYRLFGLGLSPLQTSSQAVEYLNLGRAILRGNWADNYFVARPPLMPVVVAVVFRFFTDSQVALALVNVTVGAVTAGVAYALAQHLTSNISIARLAGVLTAIDPASIASNINLQAEALTNFFLALSFLWLALTIKRQRLSDAALAGLWLALAMLARPTPIYLFAFCLPLFIALLGKQSPRFYLAFAVLPVLCLLGWSARNFAFIGQFTFSTVSDFNLLFYRAVSVERGANSGKSDDVIRREFAAEIERRVGSPIEGSQIDSGFFWRNFAPDDGRRVTIMRTLALDVFRAHPLWYIATIPGGLYHMYAYTELIGSPFWPELIYNIALYTAATLGLVIRWRQRDWLTLGLSLTFIIYITTTTIISQTTGMDTRMRTPLTVPLTLLAAAAIMWVRDKSSGPQGLLVWLKSGRAGRGAGLSSGRVSNNGSHK